jgi:hypothetical protein
MCKTLLSLTHCIVPKDTYICPCHLKRVFSIKWMILPLQNALRSQVFFSQDNSVLTGKNVLDPPACNIDGFLPRDRVLLPFNSMELFCDVPHTLKS